MSAGARVAGVGVLTGWGEGVGALPPDARVAAGGRAVIALGRPALDGERFRRATRECLLGVAAVHAMLREADLGRDAIRGERTALLFVTAGAYGASNVEFIVAGGIVGAGGASAGRSEGGLAQERRGIVGAGGASAGRSEGGLAQERRGSVSALHFPYTAPSALAGEVAIEFGLTGAYVILIGGAPATVDALWQAGRLLAEGRCERALVVAVETFEECETLWRRARWALPAPLVEAAACALLVAGDAPAAYRAVAAAGPLEAAAEARAGRTLAAAPLIALALARAAGEGAARITGTWRGRTAGIELEISGQTARV